MLTDINFIAEPGAVVALVGPTGAGKTTIVNLLGRFYDPDGGGILLDGRDARNFRSSSIRRHMAFVLQETFLFFDTLAGNIRYGRPDASDEEVRRAAEQANAIEFIEDLPDGFESVVGNEGMQLSRGQIQRISLARALLADPVLLVLDEATSDVDTETEALIQQGMDAAMAGRTVFVIAPPPLHHSAGRPDTGRGRRPNPGARHPTSNCSGRAVSIGVFSTASSQASRTRNSPPPKRPSSRDRPCDYNIAPIPRLTAPEPFRLDF